MEKHFFLLVKVITGCLCYHKKLLVYPMLCLFFVFDIENLDAFLQCKMIVTK